jgi:hypothetical protein
LRRSLRIFSQRFKTHPKQFFENRCEKADAVKHRVEQQTLRGIERR